MGDQNEEFAGKGDQSDAINTPLGTGDTTDAGHSMYVGISSLSAASKSYDMRHKRRGWCFIFNNKKFEAQTNLNERRGTDADAARLHERFRELDFDVKIFSDFSKKKILETLNEVARLDHSDSDCFVCCLLTHGDNGVLYGCDGKFLTADIFEPFAGDKCPSLVGKPKLFFIQACQGDRLDHGTTLYCRDAADSYNSYRIPSYADFLMAYSTIPGFYSWRNTTEGSWFVQALCKVLQEHGRKEDLLTMLTYVNHMVSFQFESCVPTDSSMNKKKQTPCINSMLTRKVYFPPKK